MKASVSLGSAVCKNVTSLPLWAFAGTSLRPMGSGGDWHPYHRWSEAPLELKVQGETARLWLLDLLPTHGVIWSTTSESPIVSIGKAIIQPLCGASIRVNELISVFGNFSPAVSFQEEPAALLLQPEEVSKTALTHGT